MCYCKIAQSYKIVKFTKHVWSSRALASVTKHTNYYKTSLQYLLRVGLATSNNEAGKILSQDLSEIM